TPGVYHAAEGAVHGAATLRFLEDWRADWAICGASGINVDGATDAQADAAEVYAAMFRRADRRMIVADHKKFGQRYPARYARWADVDVLASDRPPSGPLADETAAQSVQLAVASPSAASSAETN
ncbi:MAG: DeoR/GlpR transcriptional regulator, partial [Pseudomonadota bacterium]